MQTTKQNQAPKQCSNCGTLTSSMWRRTANKQVACNACGLYYKLYGVNRPIEMRKDIVYPRNRYSKLNGKPKPPTNGSLKAASAAATAAAASNNSAYYSKANSMINKQQQSTPQQVHKQHPLLGAIQGNQATLLPTQLPQKFIVIDSKKLLPANLFQNAPPNSVSILAPAAANAANEPISLIKLNSQSEVDGSNSEKVELDNSVEEKMVVEPTINSSKSGHMDDSIDNVQQKFFDENVSNLH